MSCGWIQGKNGLWRVNPNWENPEVTLPVRPKVEVVNNQAMGEKETGKVEDGGKVKGVVAFSGAAKKKSFGTLGPRGLKRNSWKNIYGGTPANNCGGLVDEKVEGLAAFFLEDKKMRQEGYEVFPPGFNPPSFDSKKIFMFVRPDQHTSVACNYYKLADFTKEGPKYFSFNPFSQGTPFGQSQPLPR